MIKPKPAYVWIESWPPESGWYLCISLDGKDTQTCLPLHPVDAQHLRNAGVPSRDVWNPMDQGLLQPRGKMP